MGKVIMSGIVPPLVAPITGILASDLAVGSSVYLMEDGVAMEYLVVNHGNPSGSSLYDDSCDGTWLLRKDIKEARQWHSSAVNDYKNSTIHAWLNGDYFNLFGSIEKAAIKQSKIPYVNGTGSGGSVASGANGLATKVFLLGGYEIGYTTSTVGSTVPIDGAKLDYFLEGAGSAAQKKRIAYLIGAALAWHTRSPWTNTTKSVWGAANDGGACGLNVNNSSAGIRPALILPKNALFDTNTMLLKGVA